MVQPRLIHPIPVGIQQRDSANTVMRTNAREPVRQVKRDIVLDLKAQIQWYDRNDPRAMAAGLEYKSRGYLVFLWNDLTKRGITLQTGDKIVYMGKGSRRLETDLYLMESEPAAHYSDIGGPGFLVFEFDDKEPTRKKA